MSASWPGGGPVPDLATQDSVGRDGDCDGDGVGGGPRTPTLSRKSSPHGWTDLSRYDLPSLYGSQGGGPDSDPTVLDSQSQQIL